ncbi:transcription antitermination factor NusB [Desulfopila sp. IMCC35008]|uniref:transcription antitermination factor NusB n=1 Tax=Desulfopila sp. IMCC35008 TaxID=2653858 RepID=UPI0013D6A881|nr:transcription antitermination factor NusB [Desulfopila sp. IMCC35008]
MGIRRKAREAALQFLFQEDFKLEENGHSRENLQERFAGFCTMYQVNRQARPYALTLLTGVVESRQQVDDLIGQAASNWRLSRLAATDRNILRLAGWEMMQDNDVPDQVAINEAVEIAKRFGSKESPSFINGVLDAVKTVLRS